LEQPLVHGERLDRRTELHHDVIAVRALADRVGEQAPPPLVGGRDLAPPHLGQLLLVPGELLPTGLLRYRRLEAVGDLVVPHAILLRSGRSRGGHGTGAKQGNIQTIRVRVHPVADSVPCRRVLWPSRRFLYLPPVGGAAEALAPAALGL